MSNPNLPKLIAHDGNAAILSQSITKAIVFKALAVKFADSAVRSHPDVTEFILADIVYLGTRKPALTTINF
jgi:hypothetical protein